MAELPARRRLRERQSEGAAGKAPAPEGAPAGNLGRAWETFGMHSKAGQLLRQLYGPRQRVEVAYPKLTTRAESEPRRPFIPGGGRVEVDPREHKLSDTTVAVPQFPAKSQYEFHPIDFVDRRRRAEGIREELKRTQESLDHYRPNPGKEVSSAQEKERLQMTFQFRGGKALPSGVAYPSLEGDLPTSTKAREYQERRKEAESHRKQRDRLSAEEYDEMVESILSEIDERQHYMADLDRHGELAKHAFRVQREIEDRLGDLEELERLREAQDWSHEAPSSPP